MRWITFVILILVVTALQTTLAPFLAIHGARPDFLVIVAVYYALTARTPDAMLACWCAGLAIDLASVSFSQHGNVGLHALLLGLIGLVMVKLRDLTFRENVVTQLLLTFAAKLTLSLLVGVYMLYVLGLPLRLGEILTGGVYTAGYTALLAPYGHWFLRRFRNVLGLTTTHRLRVR